MAALEALSSTELLNFLVYETLTATPPQTCNESSENSFLFSNSTAAGLMKQNHPEDESSLEVGNGVLDTTSCCSFMMPQQQQQQLCCSASSSSPPELVGGGRRQNLSVQGRKKRRRRPKLCKNKEEAEAQRMTHIAVERNRRKQMNEHLAVLRSLMPESYVQRGDQASIVGGAIQFVKELEHMLQSLEAQKLQIQDGRGNNLDDKASSSLTTKTMTIVAGETTMAAVPFSPPFTSFFANPQYTCSQTTSSNNNKYMTSQSKAAVADIEVTLIETHANIRILSKRRFRQLSKMVACFQTFHLNILHLNVSTSDPFILYSISAKVEEGCLLNSADDIASAVHHMLRLIEEEEQEQN